MPLPLCRRCERGPEACSYCFNAPSEEDVLAICDCGLVDFGEHILDCESRLDKRWLIASDYDQAQEPRV